MTCVWYNADSDYIAQKMADFEWVKIENRLQFDCDIFAKRNIISEGSSKPSKAS